MKGISDIQDHIIEASKIITNMFDIIEKNYDTLKDIERRLTRLEIIAKLEGKLDGKTDFDRIV